MKATSNTVTINYTTGPIHRFDIEPGDSVSYRILFGRLPPAHWSQRSCIVFGFAEGRDALVTVVFDNDGINDETFGRDWRTATHSQTTNNTDYLEEAAYAAFSALLGRAVRQPREWSHDWREQQPAAAMG